jgi:hypothetical protein
MRLGTCHNTLEGYIHKNVCKKRMYLVCLCQDQCAGHRGARAHTTTMRAVLCSGADCMISSSSTAARMASASASTGLLQGGGTRCDLNPRWRPEAWACRQQFQHMPDPEVCPQNQLPRHACSMPTHREGHAAPTSTSGHRDCRRLSQRTGRSRTLSQSPRRSLPRPCAGPQAPAATPARRRTSLHCPA